MGKRAFDLVFASLGLIVLLPVLIVIAILIKLSSAGPVLFWQERIGRAFAPFTIYKFRTMWIDAPSVPALTIRGDSRVTRLGRFLRRTKLDELPQLFNVLKGDMSLVGPRPEVRQYVERFRADYEEILTVRPGITDEASVAYRDEEALLASASDPHTAYVAEILPRKIVLARDYLRKRSLLHDFVLIVRTLARL